MKILITGSAGFIGAHVTARLLEMGHAVVGIDSINDYYDVDLKLNRLQSLGGILASEISELDFVQSRKYERYRFIRLNTQQRERIAEIFSSERFDAVCHLASQSGVRYSVENPYAYIDNNINGFIPILEGCRHNGVGKLVYASSSSVYGDSDVVPFSEEFCVTRPASLYAATKKANELMAYSYSSLYRFQTVGLRFFTVYGPWGRPDMAPFLFSRSTIEGRPIKVFNNGDLYRDFTYIDDIVEGIVRILFDYTNEEEVPYSVFNIGNHTPVKLTDFIKCIEQACGKSAIVQNEPMQLGDVHTTYADVSKLINAVGFAPNTSLTDGIGRLVDWLRWYYKM